MGRPRKKRKYTRRAKANVIIHEVPEFSGADYDAAKDLSLRLRAQLGHAPPKVRKLAVMDLLADLNWMATFYDNPPAP